MPLIRGILTQRLATLNVALLSAAVNTLKELVVRTWPRLNEYKLDIWRGLTVCWIRIDELPGTRKEFQAIKETMQQIARGLRDAANPSEDLDVAEHMLVSANKGLEELLKRNDRCTNRAIVGCADENVQAVIA